MDGMEKYKLSLVYDFMVREHFKGGEEWFSRRVGLELVMARIAFFCINTILLIHAFGAQLTMSGQ